MTDAMTAVIRIAGLTLTAPCDLLKASGWILQKNSDDEMEAVDHSSNGYVTRRLLRALHKCGVSGQDNFSPGCVRFVLCTAVNFAEMESSRSRREQAILRAAELEAKAAADRLSAARLLADPVDAS